MGGGDLNFKKSFHPLTFRNQERIWKEEHKAEEEQKKLEQLRKELEEERQLQALQKLQEDRGQRKKSERLDWMYAAGPGGAPAIQSAEQEAYLLGQRRVDPLLRQSKDDGIPAAGEEVRKGSARDVAYLGNQNANTVRDMQAKIREDPLFAIKKREQSTIKTIASNPIRMREWREEKEGGGKKDKRDKEGGSRRDRHHHRERKEEGRVRREKLSRRSEESRKRSRSPDDRVNDHHRSSRRMRPSHGEDSHHGSGAASSHREDNHHRYRATSSFRREGGQSSRHDRDRTPRDRLEPRKEGRSSQKDGEDKERRLKAMMDNAKKTQEDRAKRLAKADEDDRVQQELEEVARRRSRMGDADIGFIRQAQRSVYSSATASIADRIQQGSGGRSDRRYQ
ncbi:Pre-mRNA splicing factor-domain-containing protein [Piptocephalis cylindrospora]|uniref:Pre-mRNA splicing factor-domain-containing protein n=1 Tax=Piptocephalis cylindrospora TaxID=1907219 RepID=A0A4P9Y820_9FUNG|nr:Pre-mRNA splicing factor-domain-containing protein [Piptocephalis cylindrospora]|eukprot:RKP15213.1 Pre-mRNA splicing factor-domain-containing protein [Piptocephalis cylindrospora]